MGLAFGSPAIILQVGPTPGTAAGIGFLIGWWRRVTHRRRPWDVTEFGQPSFFFFLFWTEPVAERKRPTAPIMEPSMTANGVHMCRGVATPPPPPPPSLSLFFFLLERRRRWQVAIRAVPSVRFSLMRWPTLFLFSFIFLFFFPFYFGFLSFSAIPPPPCGHAPLPMGEGGGASFFGGGGVDAAEAVFLHQRPTVMTLTLTLAKCAFVLFS